MGFSARWAGAPAFAEEAEKNHFIFEGNDFAHAVDAVSFEIRRGEFVATTGHQLSRDGLTIVVVTHHSGMAAAASRRMAMADGRLAQQS